MIFFLHVVTRATSSCLHALHMAPSNCKKTRRNAVEPCAHQERWEANLVGGVPAILSKSHRPFKTYWLVNYSEIPGCFVAFLNDSGVGLCLPIGLFFRSITLMKVTAILKSLTVFVVKNNLSSLILAVSPLFSNNFALSYVLFLEYLFLSFSLLSLPLCSSFLSVSLSFL